MLTTKEAAKQLADAIDEAILVEFRDMSQEDKNSAINEIFRNLVFRLRRNLPSS